MTPTLHGGQAVPALASAFLLFALGVGQVGSAQSFSPYSDFEAMTVAELETLQVKLTYVGKQGKPLPSVAFTSVSNTLDVSLFDAFHRPGIHYGNDELHLLTCEATAAELAAVVDGLGELPSVRAGQALGRYLSLSFFNGLPGGAKGFEAILTEPATINPDTILGTGDARQAHHVVAEALAGNADCMDILKTQWQALGFGIDASLNPDADGDGLADTDEDALGTEPLDADSDNDGRSDGLEVNDGTDPLNPFDRQEAEA